MPCFVPFAFSDGSAGSDDEWTATHADYKSTACADVPDMQSTSPAAATAAATTGAVCVARVSLRECVCAHVCERRDGTAGCRFMSAFQRKFRLLLIDCALAE